MKIIQTQKALQQALRFHKNLKHSIALIPTMGALHSGHGSLVKLARAEADCVVVTLFINPKQFGPTEDLNSYPKTIPQDQLLCKKWGCDILYIPNAKYIFSSKYWKSLTNTFSRGILCDLSRPGHFDGVISIVAYFFNLVKPNLAYFGEKDYQQLAVIRDMNRRHFNSKISIRQAKTIRHKSGLAMSSRNKRLSSKQKLKASIILKAMQFAERRYRDGEALKSIKIRVQKRLKSNDLIPQYIEIFNEQNMRILKRNMSQNKAIQARIAIAAYLDNVRLIDNLRL
ncbi:MAG: pantoate--beta-alanine ligase [Candidatus Omnitrophota bacterium]|jgi:pantoate--beta-alanine ligase